MWRRITRGIPWRIRKLLLRWIGCSITEGCYIERGMTTGGGKVRIGKNVYINKFLLVDGLGEVSIGENVLIGPACKIITSTHQISRDPLARARVGASHLPVVIGRGVWVCAGATILPGVTIGEGCVIAAGAVVTKTTQSNGLYGGVPAERIRDLPS